MVSVTAALLINLLHLDASFDDATMENLIDQSIDMTNLYGNLDLSNMSGTAGSKTVELTTHEKGAVVTIVRTVYNAFYENSEGSMSVSGITISSPDLMGNPTVVNTIKEVSRLLYKQLNELEVDIG